MSNILKSKIFFIVFSLLILTLIPLLRSNLNAEVTLHKWRKLTWDDFQGIVKPFTYWDAGISSNVFIEYDSVQEKYIAYAAMNDQYSWKKESVVNSDYVLNHEQYHFNITEYFARKLNHIIDSEQLVDESEILVRLSTIRAELDMMQDNYDRESGHSINKDYQRLWEFKIDSLLASYEPNGGYLTDYYSGAKILMPSDFILKSDMTDNSIAFREYQFKKYDMNFWMISFQDLIINSEYFKGFIKKMQDKDTHKIVSVETDSTSYILLEFYDKDEKESQFQFWTYQDGLIYYLETKFPEQANMLEYRKIAKSYINSFKIVNTEKYWLDKYDAFKTEVIQSKIIPNSKNKKKDLNTKCVTHYNPQVYGFYGKPFYTKNGGLLFPYKITAHADSLIDEVMLIHNKEWYTYSPDAEDHIFHIPAENLSNGQDYLNFGYTLKEDSINKCYTFYKQTLVIPQKPTKENL